MPNGRSLAFRALLLCLPIAEAHAQACERLPPAPGASGYQLRRGSDRCEGIYVSPVSGGGLQLVSFTFGKIAYELERDTVLLVAAPAGAASGLKLQGTGIPIGLYYRLDAALGVPEPFRLPLVPVIRPQRIAPPDLGLLAYREIAGGRRVFVPVHVGLDPARMSAATGRLAILRPDIDMQNVRWRLTAGGAVPGAFSEFANAQGPVPSGQRLEIALPPDPGPQEATLEIRYTDLAGRERATRFLLASR